MINNLLQNTKSTIIKINADQDIDEVSKQIHKKMLLAGFKPINKEWSFKLLTIVSLHIKLDDTYPLCS